MITSDKLNSFQLSTHFNLREFDCKCCGSVIIHPDLILKVEILRQLLDVPLVINSGYRCPVHNKAVKGDPRSLHMKGLACDISTQGINREKFLACARRIGFGGVGLYDSFVHLDIGPQRSWRG